jgi:prevent-host-death family protein
MLDTCLKEGPQVVTKRGAKSAVLVAFDDWTRLQQSARPSLKELLLTDVGRGDIDLPPRGWLRRKPPTELL